MRLCQLGSWRAAVGLAVLSQQPGNHTLAIGARGGQTTVPDGEAGTGCPQAAPSAPEPAIHLGPVTCPGEGGLELLRSGWCLKFTAAGGTVWRLGSHG